MEQTLTNTTGRYVLGVGTGRCGTKSLARLLNDCGNVSVTHEMDGGDVLPWNVDNNVVHKRIRDIRGKNGDLVGDVGAYYLNSLGIILVEIPDIKIIHIHRKKSEVVKSFMAKTKGKNHLAKAGYAPDRWDKAFPDYPLAKSKAIGKYVDLYMDRMDRITQKYHKQVYTIDVKELNNPKEQYKLFNWLDIPKPNRVYQSVNENRIIRQ